MVENATSGRVFTFSMRMRWDDYLAINRASGRVLIAQLLIGAGACLMLTMPLLVKPQGPPRDLKILYFWVMVIAALAVSAPWLAALGAWVRERGARPEYTVHVSEEQIELEIEGETAVVPWSEFSRVTETERMFLLWGRLPRRWLPVRKAALGESTGRFGAMVRRKLKPSKRAWVTG
jgi:hypothetical protein